MACEHLTGPSSYHQGKQGYNVSILPVYSHTGDTWLLCSLGRISQHPPAILSSSIPCPDCRVAETQRVEPQSIGQVRASGVEPWVGNGTVWTGHRHGPSGSRQGWLCSEQASSCSRRGKSWGSLGGKPGAVCGIAKSHKTVPSTSKVTIPSSSV